MQEVNFDEAVEQILAKDERFHRDAYGFMREALDFTQKIISAKNQGKVRHVTGQELLDGIRQFSLQQFGPMACCVLEEWGIRKCEDFGAIVFNLVEHEILSKTENDSLEDFSGGFDFQEAFRRPFQPSGKPEDEPSSG